MIYLVTGILVISCVLNAILLFVHFNKKLGKSEYSQDARALLRDLASGPALVKIEYMDRADVLIRSPRHL